MAELTTKVRDEAIERFKNERKAAQDYQIRRHIQWNENYKLYRDFVDINRLTQRQSVNIPLMKETIKTLLAGMDEAPDIYFVNLNNEKEKEYILNEFWLYDSDRVNLDGIDIQDKKNVLLYGRSFIKLNFIDGFEPEVLDIYDIIVDPKTNPLKLETARYLIHQNIFRPLEAILNNDKYTKEGKDKLKTYLYSKKGLIASGDNRVELEKKKERLRDMGAEDYSSIDDLLGGFDVIVSLCEHYTTEWNKEKKEFVRYVQVIAEDSSILFKDTLENVLGIKKWPFTTWTADIEVSDFWTDGEADVIRQINKVLNAWISQGIENRTYRNFGMNYYDASNAKGFNPKSFTPEPWGWYPVPGNPNEIIKRVDVLPLTDSIEDMRFLIGLAEKATGTPAEGKGVTEKKRVLLGELEIVVGKAMERIKGTAKFYRRARKELAEIWLAIIDANMINTETIKLFRTSYKGNIFIKDARPSDWRSKAGYRVRITSSSEQDTNNAQTLQRMLAVKNEFPNNPAVQRIFKKRLLEVMDISQEEIKEIMDYDKNVQAPQAPPLRTMPDMRLQIQQ